MSSKFLVLLVACLAFLHGADAACSATTAATCFAGITINPLSLSNTYVCDLVKKQIACYNTAGCCTATSFTSALNTIKTAYSKYITGCDLTCGATAAATTKTATATKTTVTQKFTFASLTVAGYTGNTKGNLECAYINTLENGGTGTATWCVATTTSPFRTYKSGVSITSSASRRSASVTFNAAISSDIKSNAQLKTLVSSHSTATKFATSLTAVNTASGLTITAPGDATVATATFSGTATASAASVVPSMLVLVFALFVAFGQ